MIIFGDECDNFVIDYIGLLIIHISSCVLYHKTFKFTALLVYTYCTPTVLLNYNFSVSSFITQRYTFVKITIPEDIEGKTELAKKLMKYNTSLQEYSLALQRDEIQ